MPYLPFFASKDPPTYSVMFSNTIVNVYQFNGLIIEHFV